ncbi:MAG: eight transrane protein EpsH [Rhodospirillales bacterium]|nr:eight transrane protein EpsH [Rhodospirillales bacterium]
MSTISVPTGGSGVSVQRLWSGAIIVLAIGAIAFGIVFRVEVARAVAVWEESTAFNHCFLILPISAYLIWERRQALAARPPQPNGWVAIAMLPMGLVWLISANAEIMEGRQLAAMSLFQLFVLAVLGFQVWRVSAFALLYLYFLVPSGAFLTAPMQDFAARFAVAGVELLGIPVYSSGLNIEVPGARFTVAEACAGLRFLIASVALGTLYGYTMYRSWKRRAAFIVVSIIVPIIANGMRVMAIVLLGYWLGNAEAATADHLIYGWVFFSMVSVILILLGLPFRQDVPAFAIPSAEANNMRRQQLKMVATAGISILLIAILVSPITTYGPVGGAMDAVVMALKHILGR